MSRWIRSFAGAALIASFSLVGCTPKTGQLECTTSIDDYGCLAAGTTNSGWRKASCTVDGNNGNGHCSSSVIRGCGDYDVVLWNGVDTGEVAYYDASTGKLVAVTAWSANFDGSTACVAGPSGGFNVPTCPSKLAFTGPGFVVDRVFLPTQGADYAVDLDYDKKLENQLGNAVGTLLGMGVDAQSVTDSWVNSGGLLAALSMGETTTPDLTTCGSLSVRVASATTGGSQGTPDFSGAGSFTIDANAAPAIFSGKLDRQSFSGTGNGSYYSPPAIVHVRLPGGSSTIDLPIDAAQLQFSAGTDESSGAPGLIKGKFQGTIRSANLQRVLYPWIAAMLSSKICPTGKYDAAGACTMCATDTTAQRILGMFDNGGCDAAKNGDCRIDGCEVLSNRIIGPNFAPDVRMFTDDGHYRPDATNSAKDSLSLGMGFTAVKASIRTAQ